MLGIITFGEWKCFPVIKGRGRIERKYTKDNKRLSRRWGLILVLLVIAQGICQFIALIDKLPSSLRTDFKSVSACTLNLFALPRLSSKVVFSSPALLVFLITLQYILKENHENNATILMSQNHYPYFEF